MNMLGEDPPHNVKLRQAGSGVRRLWDVELVIEEGHMYLCRGWEKFYSAYDLRTGYFLLFRQWEQQQRHWLQPKQQRLWL
nr:B3 domain-containing protein Os03g0212300-like [Aegilops tauschii subsp. strangulata]